VASRSFECLAAAAGIVLLSPLFGLIALAIKLDDGGPVLFTQPRLGARKQPFRIYKFRTMRDGWITAFGCWLRTTGLDELPQLANVFVGDMSLVGPRPLTVDDVTRLAWCDERHAVRWTVRPGITGLAQLFAGRGARLSWFLDRRYIESPSLRLNVAILALSIVIILVGKHRLRRWLRRSRRATRPISIHTKTE